MRLSTLHPTGVIGLDLELKQKQFNYAMELYTTRTIYREFGRVVSTINVSLQIYLLYQLLHLPIAAAWQIAALIAAFIATDFISGLVHMYMDNNDSYDSIAGPFIANFHLHHQRPVYRKKPIPIVYFVETGSKVWLVGYLLAVSLLVAMSDANPIVTHFLVYVGVLSSVAEVSHYLCHSSTSTVAMFIGRIGVLLPKRHHAVHHANDNTNYAFLNGVSDPLINLVARKLYQGYKKTTDRHFARYVGAGSENR
jgi:hypothetical protein